MKTVRGKKVIYIYDKYNNVVVTEQFADCICDELNNSIPIEWIENYSKCQNIQENERMIQDWKEEMKLSEMSNIFENNQSIIESEEKAKAKLLFWSKR